MRVRHAIVAVGLALAVAWPASGRSFPVAGSLADSIWVVDAVPLTSIGRAEGSEVEVLTGVIAASKLDNGEIVVVMSAHGIAELRWYDSSGRFLRTASRYGDGPGEFRGISGAFRLGADSIIGFGVDGRYAVFDGDGDLARTGKLASLAGTIPLGLRTDGAILVWRPSTPIVEGVVSVERSQYFRVNLDGPGQPLDLGTMRSFEVLHSGGAFLPRPFTPHSVGGAGGDAIWVGESRSGEVHVRVAEETRPRVLALGSDDAPRVTWIERRRFRSYLREQERPGDNTQFERRIRSLPFPRAMPHFGDLVVDRSGNAWLAEYRPPWDLDDPTWMVFSPSGERIAQVRLPPGFGGRCGRPGRGYEACEPFLEIGSDYVLAKHIDELGVERVRVLALSRSRESGAR